MLSKKLLFYVLFQCAVNTQQTIKLVNNGVETILPDTFPTL